MRPCSILELDAGRWLSLLSASFAARTWTPAAFLTVCAERRRTRRQGLSPAQFKSGCIRVAGGWRPVAAVVPGGPAVPHNKRHAKISYRERLGFAGLAAIAACSLVAVDYAFQYVGMGKTWRKCQVLQHPASFRTSPIRVFGTSLGQRGGSRAMTRRQNTQQVTIVQMITCFIAFPFSGTTACAAGCWCGSRRC